MNKMRKKGAMRLPKSTTKLKQYFPMIREREDIEREIRENPKLLEKYREWDEEQQEEFLDYCTGVKGVKVLYDAFFKEIMNPENTPERLNELLSLLLGQSVTIKRVLPGDSTRLADEQSLLIMDILVELADTSLANVEVQKIGYSFPGQRSACYSSDLLLRQYKRVKGEKKKAFSYKDIKSVYTIVFLKQVSKNFMNIHKTTFTNSNSSQTQVWNWNYCKNMCSYRLTFSVESPTIILGIRQKRGSHF